MRWSKFWVTVALFWATICFIIGYGARLHSQTDELMISVTSHELDTYGGVTFYELRRGATSVVLSADSKHPAIAYLKRHPNQRIALQMSAEEKR